MIPRQTLTWMQAGEQTLADAVPAATPVTAPSRLPGWSRAHVLAHLAGNATALCNLLHWARTGIETPMYPSRAARQAEIDQWSAADPDKLRAHVADESAQLAEAVAELPEEAWDAPVRSALGREIPASDVPWLRTREVWIHAVDLDAGFGFEQIPPDLAAALIADITAALSKKDSCPAVVLHDRDSGARWRMSPDAPAGADADTVVGDVADLLGWISGRTDGSRLHASIGSLPHLPSWL